MKKIITSVAFSILFMISFALAACSGEKTTVVEGNSGLPKQIMFSQYLEKQISSNMEENYGVSDIYVSIIPISDKHYDGVIYFNQDQEVTNSLIEEYGEYLDCFLYQYRLIINDCEMINRFCIND